MKTLSPTPKHIKRGWHLFDANGQILGRLASRIANVLNGKNKPEYASHFDMADHVVVINAAKVQVTGKKEKQKLYRRHSGYPGGLKTLTLAQVRAKSPTRIIVNAVKGMLPKNRLQAKRLKHLHVFEAADHPFEKQFKRA